MKFPLLTTIAGALSIAFLIFVIYSFGHVNGRNEVINKYAAEVAELQEACNP